MDPIFISVAIADPATRHCVEQIRERAHRLHDSVNQHYDTIHPYGLHLDMVAGAVLCYAPAMPPEGVPEEDLAAVMFGAFFHDAIEDARLTYSDLLAIASKYLPDDKALMATEIVYALTNEKGRTRAERADERYYAGIRVTPYAPMVKIADRIANMTYSAHNATAINPRMHRVYAAELPHFIQALTVEPAAVEADPRLAIPQVMIDQLHSLL